MDKTNKVLLLVTAVVVIAAAIYLLSSPKGTSNTYTQIPENNQAIEDENMADENINENMNEDENLLIEDEAMMYNTEQKHQMYEAYLGANISNLSEQGGEVSINSVNWIGEDNAIVTYADSQGAYTAEARFVLSESGEVMLSYFNATPVQEENNQENMILENETNMEGSAESDVMMEEEIMP